MHRKTPFEECERARNLDATSLKQKCLRFVEENSQKLAAAQPQIPDVLNDRAADIWEPLLALADLAGGDWPTRARQAAISLTASAQENNPIGALLLDIFITFQLQQTDRLFTKTLLQGLTLRPDRPWAETRNGKPITDIWLSQQLRPYGIRPKTVWIGGNHAKGYFQKEAIGGQRRLKNHVQLRSSVGLLGNGDQKYPFLLRACNPLVLTPQSMLS